MPEFEDLEAEPVDPTVLMQFSRYDAYGNLLVKIHRSDGRYDRRILKSADGLKIMQYLASVLVEDLDEVPVLVPVPPPGNLGVH